MSFLSSIVPIVKRRRFKEWKHIMDTYYIQVALDISISVVCRSGFMSVPIDICQIGIIQRIRYNNVLLNNILILLLHNQLILLLIVNAKG